MPRATVPQRKLSSDKLTARPPAIASVAQRKYLILLEPRSQSSSMAAARGAKARKGRSGTKKISGVDFTWDPDLDDNKPAPSPLFPVS